MAPRALLAVALVALAATAGAQEIQDCSSSSDCPTNQYCTYYEGSGGAVAYCYACVDSFGFTCADYDDSIDDCSRCPTGNSPSNQTEHIECESHDDCAGDFYCAAYAYNQIQVQACWPCVDEQGRSCSDYGDALGGACPAKCLGGGSGSAPLAPGCTTHSDCQEGEYCSSYKAALTGQDIVACYPCVDADGHTCQYWDDAINGRCDVCDGAGDGAPYVNSCTTHAECPEQYYCSSYRNPSVGLIVDCWPCVDDYSNTCADNGDSVDGSCARCDAYAPAPPPRPVDEGCARHEDCSPGEYCGEFTGRDEHAVHACLDCVGRHNVTCESMDNSVDGSCDYCTKAPAQGLRAPTNATSLTLALVFSITGTIICMSLAFLAYGKWRDKRDDQVALRDDHREVSHGGDPGTEMNHVPLQDANPFGTGTRTGA